MEVSTKADWFTMIRNLMKKRSLKFQQLRASQMRIVRESLDLNHHNKASQVVVRTYE